MSDLLLTKRIQELYREARVGVLVSVLCSSDPRLVGARLLAAQDASGSFEWLENNLTAAIFRDYSASLASLVADLSMLLEGVGPGKPIQVKRPLAGADDLLTLELIHDDPDLIICGGGHVGQALASMARLLDMTVAIIDDREEFANRKIFPDPGVRLIVERYEAGLQKLRIRLTSSIVIVTRAHQHDERCLRVVLNSRARYIGMIGSPRRVLTVLKKLAEDGCPAEGLARVKAPIGLDIGAQSPAEIAISILAEIIMAKYSGSGLPKSRERNLIQRLPPEQQT